MWTVIESPETELEVWDSEHIEKDLLDSKVPVFGVSSAAAVWQTTWALLYKAFWIAL